MSRLRTGQTDCAVRALDRSGLDSRQEAGVIKSLLLACVVLVTGCSPVSGTAPALPAKTGSRLPVAQHLTVYPVTSRQQTPSAPFTTERGEAVTLQQFAGQVVVLHLWATWCNPCVHEMPLLDRLAAEMPSVEIVPISVDVLAEKAVTFFQRQLLQHLGAYHDPDDSCANSAHMLCQCHL